MGGSWREGRRVKGGGGGGGERSGCHTQMKTQLQVSGGHRRYITAFILSSEAAGTNGSGATS